MYKPTVVLYLDKRRQSADGKWPVRIRVTFKREQRFYSTGINVDELTWERLQNLRLNPNDGRKKDEQLKALYVHLFESGTKRKPDGTITNDAGYLKKAQAIIDQLVSNFSFEAFRQHWNQDSKDFTRDSKNNVLEALLEKEKAMFAEGRVGSGLSYGNAARSLTRFISSIDDIERTRLGLPVQGRKKQPLQIELLFELVTSNFLHCYEVWMLKCGRAPHGPQSSASPASLTTIGIYLRQLRSVFNEAITKGLTPSSSYPFGKGGYVIPAGKNQKKAKNKDDVLKILAYQAEDPKSYEQRSKDLWTLSYLTNGANFADLLTLRWQDIDSKSRTVRFVRNKTARTRKANQQVTSAKLFDQSIEIIERWGILDRNPDAFIFPFLSTEMSPQRKKAVICQVIKVTNKWMKVIAGKSGVEGDISTYAARHSFATILLRSNAPLAFISQSLGHTNLKTTQNYLGSFGDDQTEEFLSALI